MNILAAYGTTELVILILAIGVPYLLYRGAIRLRDEFMRGVVEGRRPKR